MHGTIPILPDCLQGVLFKVRMQTEFSGLAVIGHHGNFCVLLHNSDNVWVLSSEFSFPPKPGYRRIHIDGSTQGDLPTEKSWGHILLGATLNPKWQWAAQTYLEYSWLEGCCVGAGDEDKPRQGAQSQSTPSLPYCLSVCYIRPALEAGESLM